MTLPDFLRRGANGEIRLTGHRIDLMHVVDCYNDGCSTEMLHEQCPTLSLELINQVLVYYRENRVEIDAYVAQCHEEIERNLANYRPGPGILKLRHQLEMIEQAEGRHASDPEWPTLSVLEKLRRVESEGQAETM